MERQTLRLFKFIRGVGSSLGLTQGLTLSLVPGLILMSCASTQVKSKELNLEVQTPKNGIEQGRVFSVHLNSKDELNQVKGAFFDKEILFYRSNTIGDKDFKYSALVGTDAKQGPGLAEFRVRVCKKFDPTNCSDQKFSIKVVDGKFPSEKLSVPPRTIEPNKKDLIRIKKEAEIINKIYSQPVLEVLWNSETGNKARMPVDSEITSVFGTRRIYNGKTQSAHYGTDLRAPTGTNIVTPIRGKVVLAKDLFYTGNTVILDHGFGFFTIYGHLSKLSVKEGSIVEIGTLLGLSGATGRASGPHLHWGVQLHGMKVDPISVLKFIKSGDT